VAVNNQESKNVSCEKLAKHVAMLRVDAITLVPDPNKTTSFQELTSFSTHALMLFAPKFILRAFDSK
jgi:hypothetical protein